MKNNQIGQSTIEFLFCFIFAVSFILLVFNTSINYVSGYVTHYATCMASRVLLTQSSFMSEWGPGNTISNAEQVATQAFQKYSLSAFGVPNSSFKLSDAAYRDSVQAGEYLLIGTITKFDKKMDIIGRITGQTKLELISESYLGREPTRGVCASRVCRAITDDRDQCDASIDITLFDDGC